MSATTLLYPGDRTCRRRVTTLSTVSLEAELVSVTMTDLRSSMVSCKITVTSLVSPRAPDVTETPVDSGQESAASRDIRLEADESAIEVHLMLTRAPLGGGAISSPPLVFLRYLLNQWQVSPPNLQYPLSQQFYTLC